MVAASTPAARDLTHRRTIVQMSQIEEMHSIEELERIEGDWTELWNRDSNTTPFQSPHWLLPWWNAFGDGELCAFVTRDGNAKLTALAPLSVLRDDDSDEALGVLVGTGISDYLDILCADPAAVDDIVNQAVRLRCTIWDWHQLRPSSPLLWATAPESWSESVQNQDACPVLELGPARGELENLLSPHARKKLRYYSRCAEREGPVSYESATAESLDHHLGALFDLHTRRWERRGLPGLVGDAVTRRFHTDVCRRMLAAGALRMYALRIAGRFVAVFYGFAHHGTTYYYLSGYDTAFEKLSPGQLIVAHAIRRAIAEGATAFDFLRGAEAYKYAWGAADRINRRRQLARM